METTCIIMFKSQEEFQSIPTKWNAKPGGNAFNSGSTLIKPEEQKHEKSFLPDETEKDERKFIEDYQNSPIHFDNKCFNAKLPMLT
jgi:hypothetical protein